MRKPPSYPYPPHPAIIALDDAAFRAGLNRGQTAQAAGFPISRLWKWRNGRKPSPESLRLIEDAIERLEAMAALAPLIPPPRRRRSRYDNQWNRAKRKAKPAKPPKPERPPKPKPPAPTSFWPDPFKPGTEWPED